MGAQIIDGKAIADAVITEVKEKAQQLLDTRGVRPGLAVIMVGDNPASAVYVRNKAKKCEEMGFLSQVHHLDASVSQDAVGALIDRLNRDPQIHGILLQMPVPKHLDGVALQEAILPGKDVDGFHPVNMGRLALGLSAFVPCTPLGVRELLVRSGVDPSGRLTVIVGRSNIVGRPLALLLMRKERGGDATVCVCHSRTPNLGDLTRQADILVAAIGSPQFIKGGMVKPGAVVIDVGINRVEDSTKKSGYRLVGDVDFEAACEVAGAITPVPGGVGPMTIAMLMHNTVAAAWAQSS
ncbi:MAG: bifunctional methylenetetrahydrofolate dehydrogenase/methenyltetrahydrofolate cyclohydrolase FolD [Candidatus Sumerlaeia bacterium]|nr:bifunctional methylenetetrahydrofolate dehydrogenase/methenyltetrahydrofolate cyclohydrolase FolD [Candidatus Sumerlaeia bacterium]